MTTIKTVKLGTLIKPAKLQKCGNDDYPVLSVTMHNGLVFQSDKFKKSVASQDKSTYKVVHRNQLVIGFPIDEGVLATQRITDAGIVSPAYGIWDVDQTKIIPEFLEYALRCDRALDYYKAKLRGSTARRRSLPTPTLLELDVPLPDIEQQKLALTTLHHAKNALDSRQEQLAKLDELVKARFAEMFENSSWPITSLNDICSEIVDCPHSTPQYEGNLKYPAIRTTEIKRGYIDWKSMKYVSEEEYHNRIRSLKPAPGDIVYGREGTYGNAAIIPNGYEFCLGQRVMLFRPNKIKCISEYVLYAILSDRVKRQADEKNVGTTVPHVNVADAKQFDVVLPPLSLQNEFAAFVERVDQQKQTVQQSLEKLELMKKALMQEYFG